jgi:hypothetical protein
MGYVFSEILPWILGAVLVGFGLGWLFWRCRLWLGAGSRAGTNTIGMGALADARQEEIDRLKVQLEQSSATVTTLKGRTQASDADVIALRSQVASLEPENRRLRAAAAEMASLDAEVMSLRIRVRDLESDLAQMPRLHDRIEELEAHAARIPGMLIHIQELEAAATGSPLDLASGEAPSSRSHPNPVVEIARVGVSGVGPSDQATGQSMRTQTNPGGQGEIEIELDLEAAASILGSKLRVDDLKAVEGIGPKIAELLEAAGIESWRRLAETDVAELSALLDRAGPRFRIHDPGSWPAQAELLAAGRWDEFKELTKRTKGSRVE